MRTGFVQGVLIALGAYSVAAVFAFLLHFSPSAGSGHLGESVICAALVLLPYVALFAACRMPTGRLSQRIVTLASLVCVAIGGYVYWFSFGPNDGEYALAYYVVPALQLPFVIAAWGAVLWERLQGRDRSAA